MSKDFWDLLKARPIPIKERAQASCPLNEASRDIWDMWSEVISLHSLSQFHLKSGRFLHVSLLHKSFQWFLHIRPHSPALTLFISSVRSLHVGFAFEELNEKPALVVCVTEFDPDPLLVKSESDLGPEDLAVASKTVAAELSSSSKLPADKLERGKQQQSCLTKNINSHGKRGLLGHHNGRWY